MSLFLCYPRLNPISDKYTSFDSMRQVSAASNYRWETNNNNDAFCILSALEAGLHTSVGNNLKFRLNSREPLVMREHAISAPPPPG